MPFYQVPPGFGGGCGMHPHERRHPFHHHGPPHGPPHHHHHHGPPPFPPHHGFAPMMAGGPPMFGRRGHRFMMNAHERPDAEAASDGASPNPAVDGPPFLPHRHHGPPPMMAGGPPMFGRRGRRFMMNMKDLHEKSTAEATTNGDADPSPPFVFNKPLRRPHCRRGGPRGRCSDLPREEESPVEVPNDDTKQAEAETPKGLPGVQCSFRHYPPRPPHMHRRRHFHKKMMLLSLLEEQKRAMEEISERNKNDLDETKESTTSSVIQVPQEWHAAETDQSLVLSIDVTGFKLENLELKVENGILSLHGRRTNSLGDIFELHRTKLVDSSVYNETGIEARCDNQDESSILRITVPKKEYTPVNDGPIPIQYAECVDEVSNESSTSTTATVVEESEKEETQNTSGGSEDNIFIPEAEIVFEPDEEEALNQVETVQDSSVASLEETEDLEEYAAAVDASDDLDAGNDSDSTQSWEDLVVDERENLN